jgi:RNA-directed DNA polymerase
VFHAAERGTPQGGVVSPLLANIALHGMEEALGVKYDSRGQLIGKRAVVRYADDFVCFCETREDAEHVQSILTEWLKERGLTLSSEKTKIVHLTEGLNFLGFNIRHYAAPLTSRTGWKLLTKPSKASVEEVQKQLREEWDKAKGTSVSVIIAKLNPIIRGWANYFRIGVAKEIFSRLDSWMYGKESHYASHTHPNKPLYWRHQKYWGRLNLDRMDRWVFGDKHTGRYLLKFNWFPIERHTLVKGTASPDDPGLKDYWVQRQVAKAKDLTLSKQKIAKRQKGACPECGESLFNDEEIEVHHRQPRAQGGRDTYGNLSLVHLLCHQHIHAKDERKDLAARCQKYNDQDFLVAQEKPRTNRRSMLEEREESCRS